MTESKTITVPFEGEGRDRAVLLLAAAEAKGLDPSVVRTGQDGFLVPEEVEKEAFGGEFAKRQADEEKARDAAIEQAEGKTLPNLTDAPEQDEPTDSESKPVAKKAAAKKSTTKKGQ